MTAADHDDQDQRTKKALADAVQVTGKPCRGCDAALCGHDAVFALVLGYKSSPRCLRCVAAHMNEAMAELRERTLTYVRHHECFLAAWHRAGELEGFGAIARPPCLWAIAPAPAPAPAADTAPSADATAAAIRWDAGDLACGDLVLELRLRLRELAPGGLLELRATDPGAPIDLPAWCSLTGHTLVAAHHPTYRIRRKS